MIRMMPPNCNCINIVGDRYDFDKTVSLKCGERQRRHQSESTNEYHISKNLEIPDWKTFLKNPTNKANLLSFIASSLSTTTTREMIPDDVTVILSGMAKDSGQSFCLTKMSVSVIDLSCKSHEEADTQIVAHLFYCVSHYGHQRAI